MKFLKRWLRKFKPRYKLTPVTDLQIGMHVLVPGYAPPSQVAKLSGADTKHVGVVFHTRSYRGKTPGFLITGYAASDKLWVKVKR